jgi:hypothetical protein
MCGCASTTCAAKASEFSQEAAARASRGGMYASVHRAPSSAPYIYRAC